MAIFALDLIPAEPNLNGNSQPSLLEQIKALMLSLRETRYRISNCSDHWHGRNFLPQGSEEAGIMRTMAENAWRLRMDVVDTMHEELLALALQIQGGSRDTKAATVTMKECLDDGTPIVHPKGWEEIEAGLEEGINAGLEEDPVFASDEARRVREAIAEAKRDKEGWTLDELASGVKHSREDDRDA